MSLALREAAAAAWPAMPLVDAKLHPAVARTACVVRARLLDILLEPGGPPIVSVVGAPGYGKTTLLAQWAAADPRPVAWLTLDPLDNDSSVLTAYLAAALASIGPAAQDVPAWWPRRDVAGGADALPLLLADLERWHRPAALVIDNAHLIVERDALVVLATLLDHLPPGVCVAFAGRAEPDLPFARYLAERRLLVIGDRALAFDDRGDPAADLSDGPAARPRRGAGPDRIDRGLGDRDLPRGTRAWAPRHARRPLRRHGSNRARDRRVPGLRGGQSPLAGRLVVPGHDVGPAARRPGRRRGAHRDARRSGDGSPASPATTG